MARVKTGYTRRRRHKKVLEMTKGQWGDAWASVPPLERSNVLKSLFYSYRDRRARRGEMRRLWIARVNAGARLNGLSYSRMMYGLKLAGVELDRKALADIAVRDAATFTKIAALSQQHLRQ